MSEKDEIKVQEYLEVYKGQIGLVAVPHSDNHPNPASHPAAILYLGGNYAPTKLAIGTLRTVKEVIEVFLARLEDR